MNGLGHPVSIPDRNVGEITKGSLTHYPFNKGLTQWLERHNAYSSAETADIMANSSKKNFSIRKAFFEKVFNERRFHQKELYYRMPFRPFIMFFMMYIVKHGFLDGRAGFDYSILRSIYEFMIEIKVKEVTSKSCSCTTD